MSLALAGCALLTPPGPAPATFDLSAPASQRRAARQSGAILVVAEPSALSALNSDRIVARPSPLLVTYFGSAQWSDRLPALVQARTIEAFENTTSLRAVGRPDQGLAADFRLVSDIRSFGVDMADGPVASVEIAVKLVHERSGRVVAARTFRARVPAASKEAEAGVTALDAALGRVLAEMVGWASKAPLRSGPEPDDSGRPASSGPS